MPETPTSRPKTERARRKPQAIRQRAAKTAPEPETVTVLPQDDPSTNYALRLTDSVEDAVAVVTAAPTPEDSFARRLNEALAAISQAQTPAVPDEPEPVRPDRVQPDALEAEPVRPAQVRADAFDAEPVRPAQVHPGVVRPEAGESAHLQVEPVVPEPLLVDAPVTYTPATRVSAYTAVRAEAEAEPESLDPNVVAEPVALLSASAARRDGSDSDADRPAARHPEAERDREAVRGLEPDGAPTLAASAAEDTGHDGVRPEAPRNPDAQVSAWRKWLATLDKMPPIRLPIGPAVPWRYGLPALLVLVAVVAVMSRSSGARPQDTRAVLPSQEVYPVQADGPLFATPTATATAIEDGGTTPVVVTRQPAPIGVQEPAGAGFDLLDIGIKLAAVLGLAYGSLVLLKKAGVGGAGRLSPGALNAADGMRVVGTVTLAPNRSVHALRVADGRTLLIGATPSSVNLLTELGELDDDDSDGGGDAAHGLLDGIRARLR